MTIDSTELQQMVSAPSSVTRIWISLTGACCVVAVWAVTTQNTLKDVAEANKALLKIVSEMASEQRDIRTQTSTYQGFADKRMTAIEMDIDKLEARLNGK